MSSQNNIRKYRTKGHEEVYLTFCYFLLSGYKSPHLAWLCELNIESYHLHNFQHGFQGGIQTNHFLCSF